MTIRQSDISSPPSADQLLRLATLSVEALTSDRKESSQRTAIFENEESMKVWPGSLYVNPKVEVRTLESVGGGRGIYATEDIPAGSVLIAERPYIWGGDYYHLLSKCREKLREGDMVISKMFDGGERSAGILRHNFHALEDIPVNGDCRSIETLDEVACGLWPFTSLMNHSSRPSVARCHMGGVMFIRAIADLPKDSEIFDNYCPTLASWTKRNDVTSTQHEFEEKKDELDMPQQVLHQQILAPFEECQSLLASGEIKADEAIPGLMEITSRLEVEGEPAKDPALGSIFLTLASLLEEEEALEMALMALAQGFELITGREPFSPLSCMVASRMALLSSAHYGPSSQSGQTKNMVKLAREQFRMVFGADENVFELLNPRLREKEDEKGLEGA